MASGTDRLSTPCCAPARSGEMNGLPGAREDPALRAPPRQRPLERCHGGTGEPGHGSGDERGHERGRSGLRQPGGDQLPLVRAQVGELDAEVPVHLEINESRDEDPALEPQVRRAAGCSMPTSAITPSRTSTYPGRCKRRSSGGAAAREPRVAAGGHDAFGRDQRLGQRRAAPFMRDQSSMQETLLFAQGAPDGWAGMSPVRVERYVCRKGGASRKRGGACLTALSSRGARVHHLRRNHGRRAWRRGS